MLGGKLIELRALACHRHRVFTEVDPGLLERRLRLQHAVARLRGAAGFRDHEHQRFRKMERGESIVHPLRIGVVKKGNWHPRLLADRLGNKLGSQRRSADADEQHVLEQAPIGRTDSTCVDALREFLQSLERLGDRGPEFRRRCEIRVA